jgi:hypothetical protein
MVDVFDFLTDIGVKIVLLPLPPEAPYGSHEACEWYLTTQYIQKFDNTTLEFVAFQSNISIPNKVYESAGSTGTRE